MNINLSKGNTFFEEGQYDRALIQYKQAMVVYEYTFPEDDETWKVIDKIRFNCNLNVAASANELGLWSETIQNCYEALKIDPVNVKALYRRAQAHRRMDNFEEAKVDLLAALRQRPHDFQLREELALLKSQIKAYKENSKAMAEKMIRKDSPSNTQVSASEKSSFHKSTNLLQATKSNYSGADDIDDPVLYDMNSMASCIAGLETCDDMQSYLRPNKVTPSTMSLSSIAGMLPSSSNEETKESWVFGDLNRPGAFVRQRPRNTQLGAAKRNCLCCA
jgi:hypothetical protein